MSEIRNEFSWSKSRDEIFQTCPRQYYFNYYGYWGSWEKGALLARRESGWCEYRLYVSASIY